MPPIPANPAGLNCANIICQDLLTDPDYDSEWLTRAGKNNWIVVTRDERIRYRVAEKQAIRRARVRAFVLAAQGNLRAEMLAEIFLKALPKVRKTVSKQKPPFIAKISRNGGVTVLQF